MGRHLLIELHGCQSTALDDVDRIESLMRQASTAAGTETVASVFHPFVPNGVTGVLILEESHLSIHTWPDSGYAAVDLYTCGDSTPGDAVPVLLEGLMAQTVEVMEVLRGVEDAERSLHVGSYERIPRQ